jgi:hypothetical protein
MFPTLGHSTLALAVKVCQDSLLPYGLLGGCLAAPTSSMEPCFRALNECLTRGAAGESIGDVGMMMQGISLRLWEKC